MGTIETTQLLFNGRQVRMSHQENLGKRNPSSPNKRKFEELHKISLIFIFCIVNITTSMPSFSYSLIHFNQLS